MRRTSSTFLASCALLVPAPADARRATATSYCLDGVTASGKPVSKRTAAHNFLWPGTKIRLVGQPFIGGLRRFVVRDTGPALSDGHFDLWTEDCSDARRWGHRPIRYKLGWAAP